MPSSSQLFDQVEAALADARILDRDLVRELLDMARALELALMSECRANLEMKQMDRNVTTASNQLKEAIELLNSAYTRTVSVDQSELENFYETAVAHGRDLLSRAKK